MSVTTTDILRSASWSDEADHEWLHQLVGDWQLLADLSFSDLVLWVSTHEGWRAAAHVRPTTGVSIFAEDLVGVAPSHELAARLAESSASGQRTSADEDVDGEPVTVETIPVRRTSATVAVLSRHMIRGNVGRRGRLESRYLGLSDALLTMVADGTFPDGGGASSGRGGAPRVGDGVVALDEGGHITYASPNVISSLHRFGEHGRVLGDYLSRIVTDGIEDRSVVEESLPLVLTGKAPMRAEIEGSGTNLALRSIPLSDNGKRIGALVLVRDVSELRRREREILTKDATIREIHHRVKNNLQTVAALLRLQSRRVDDDLAREALAEAERRIGTIALVHDTLSRTIDEAVDFDEIVSRAFTSIVEVAGRGTAVTGEFEGSFGMVAAEDANALAMVVTELVHNAVEHGLDGADGGVVRIRAVRRRVDDEQRLVVDVEDDGVGLPEGFRPGRSGLGTRIVGALVQDLRGAIRWEECEGGGTRARFEARLRPITGTERPATL